MSREAAIRKMMHACHQDPDLHKKLLEKPQDVAKEHGVTLEPEELQQLQRVKKLQDLVDEFKAGRGIHPPIGYPIDVMWKKVIANHIISYRSSFYPLFNFRYYPIRFYPIRYYPIRYYPIKYIAGYYFDVGGPQAGQQFTGLRSTKM
jgi:hypothetical protein